MPTFSLTASTTINRLAVRRPQTAGGQYGDGDVGLAAIEEGRE